MTIRITCAPRVAPDASVISFVFSLARQPFGTVGETLLTMFNMGLLGDFDRDVFQSDFSVLFFVTFMFVTIIVMLNVSDLA